MKKKIKNMFKKICILSLVAALSFTTVFSVSSIKSEAYVPALNTFDLGALGGAVFSLIWNANTIQAGEPDSFSGQHYVQNTNPNPAPTTLIQPDNNLIYDPLTNNYTNYNSYTTNVDNSTGETYYTFSNDTYDYSVSNNITYISYVISSHIDPSKKVYVDKYYILPDGRNSFNLTPRDVEGVIFNYDVINYERTNMTDKVMGIWHLDGNFHNELMQDDTSQHFNAHYSQSWSTGYFEGGAQLTKYLPQDYFALYANQSVGSGWWTLDFKAYFPSSGKTSLVDNGNGLKYYPFNPFAFLENTSAFGGYFKISPDTWHEISLVHRPDNGFVMYMDGYLCGTFTEGANKIFGTANDNFIIYDTSSNEIVFQSIATEQYTSLGNGDYGFEVLGQGFIIDEVRLSKGNLYEASEFFHYPSSMPYDSSFAYTVPSTYTDVYNSFVPGPFVPYNQFYSIYDISVSSEPTIFFSLNDSFYNNSSVSSLTIGSLTYHDNLGGIKSFYPFSVSNSSSSYFYVNSSFVNKILCAKFYIEYPPLVTQPTLYVKVTDLLGNLVFNERLSSANDFVSLNSFRIASNSYETAKNYLTFYNLDYVARNLIAIQSVFDVNSYQIGGVRKTSPVSGDVFIPYEDGKAGKAQQYFYGKWNEVNAGVFFNGKWYDITTFDFTSMMIVVDPNEYNSTNIPGGGNVVYPGTNGGSGTGGGTVINMQPVLDILNKWYGDWSVPNIEIPETLGDGFHWYDLLIFFLYFIYLFNILLRLLEIVGYGLAYAFSIISIPASSQFLNENIVTAFKYLHGETFAIVGDNGPVQVVPFVLQIGSFSLSLFDFMVLLTQLAFIAVFIRFFHTFTDYFDISKRG